MDSTITDSAIVVNCLKTWWLSQEKWWSLCSCMSPLYVNPCVWYRDLFYLIMHGSSVVYIIYCLGPFRSEHTSGWGGWGWRGVSLFTRATSCLWFMTGHKIHCVGMTGVMPVVDLQEQFVGQSNGVMLSTSCFSPPGSGAEIIFILAPISMNSNA